MMQPARLSKMRSQYNKINWRDMMYAALITVATSILGSILPIVESGTFTLQALIPVLFTSLMAGVAYIIKQLKSNSDGALLKKDGE